MIRKLKYLAKNNYAFSLVEMSIVLVIVGIIASSSISIAISTDYTTKRDETEKKLNKIEDALAGFVSLNKRLPCPASGVLPIASADFGLEVESGNTKGATCTLSNFSAGSVVGGVVPVRTLLLPDDFMFDGWGRRIDYAVDVNFTNNNITNSGACLGVAGNPCFRDRTAGSITVNDASSTARTSVAVYALISHGENGHGAFPKGGSATASRINGFPAGNPFADITAAADEYTNAKLSSTPAELAYTSTFVMRDYIRNDDLSAAANARTYFDDQVRFREKSQIVKAAGAKIYESLCQTAYDIVNNFSSVCTSANDKTQCVTFAAEINSRCVQ